MPFSAVVETKHALAAVRRATSIISRSTIPVLAYVKLSARGKKLTVSGTNLDCWLDSTFEAEEASGEVLAPGSALENALSVLPAGSQVSLKVDGNSLVMTSGRTKFDFPIMPIEDWPLGALPEKPAKLSMSARKFVLACENLRQAMSTEPTRYYLCGIFLDFANHKMVATNGLVMGWEPGPWTFDGEPPKDNFILPAEILNPLKKLLDGIDECEMLVDGETQRFTIRTELQSITSKVVDGKFPDYGRVVPNGRTHTFRAAKDDLEATLKRIAWIAADDKYRKVSLAFADGELTMSVRKAEGGGSEDACAARCVEGPDAVTVGLNGAQMAWAITTLPPASAADFHIVDAGCAICVMAEGDDDRKHLRILMPVRI